MHPKMRTTFVWSIRHMISISLMYKVTACLWVCKFLCMHLMATRFPFQFPFTTSPKEPVPKTSPIEMSDWRIMYCCANGPNIRVRG